MGLITTYHRIIVELDLLFRTTRRGWGAGGWNSCVRQLSDAGEPKKRRSLREHIECGHFGIVYGTRVLHDSDIQRALNTFEVRSGLIHLIMASQEL